MSGLREWAVHHPRVVDGCLAGLIAVVFLPVTAGGSNAPGVLEAGTGVAGLGWLWYVAVHVPLVWRRRIPVIVFWLVLGIAVASVLSGVTGVFVIFAPLFALYAVARYSPPRNLWPAAGAAVLAVALSFVRDSPEWPTLIGVVSVLLVTAMIGVNVQLRRTHVAERERHLQQEHEHQARMTVAAERAQIAREVHDIVAHNLAVMVALADGAAHTAGSNLQQAVDMMQKASMTGRMALGEMRRMVALLREGGAPDDDAAQDRRDNEDRSPQPGVNDLDQLVAQVRAAGLRVEMVYEGPVAKWTPGASLAIYRIVQEALTNTLKHAGPRARARVLLRSTVDDVELEIVDDGTGKAGTPPPPGGHGLPGIIERASAYGGHAEAGPAAGQGWRVYARLPVADSQSTEELAEN